MRIVICDDDELINEQLQKYLKYFFENFCEQNLKCPEICYFPDGESLLADTGAKDILFLDIEMPGMDGIHIGKEIKRRNQDTIIFIVTSYAEYLDDAMRFHVFRYLFKPIEKQRIMQNMKEALELYTKKNTKIPLETKQCTYTLLSSSIISIEAQGRKVIVHTTKRDFESIHTLQYWNNTLPKSCFIQTHRSYIVNLEHVTDYDHNIIRMTDTQSPAYLTKRKYKEFKEAYLLYLESTR